MRNVAAKSLCVFIALITMLSFSGCSALDDHASKEDIFSIVNEHYEMLIECINSNDFSAVERLKAIKEVDVTDDCVDFYCGGSGFGSATFYVGFYYTDTDDMRAVWCAPAPEEELSPADGGYLWKEAEGDNQYYVEPIREHFYYYEASF